MPRFKRFQNSFLGGEIDPEFLMRGDAETANQSCERARNVALLTGGGAVRRPGTRLLAYSTNKKRYTFFSNSAGDIYALAMEGGFARIIDAETGQLLTSLAAPWAEADIDDAVFVNASNGVFVFSEKFWPQFVTYEAGVLTVEPHTFALGVEGTTLQPYYRFTRKNVTMSVSGETGNISITFDGPVFRTGHIGTIFRRAGREIRITGFTNSRNGTGTVLQTLYPTFIVPLDNTAGFKVGQIVAGSDTDYEGEVVNVFATEIVVLMRNSLVGFFHSAADPTLSEKVIGPTGAGQVTGNSVKTAPASALEWDEQMISAARAYPRAAAIHRNRLVMTGFSSAPNIIAASALGSYDNFDTRQYDSAGPDASDAFIEGIGIDDIEVRHIASLENLMVLTNNGIFYVPEYNTEFAPGEVAFLRIGPDGASAAQPAVVTEGMIYVDESGGKIMAVAPTGLVARPWEVRELSQAASHLINNPKAIVAASTVGARRHRMVFVVNSDGTVAVLSYQRFENFAGWALWNRPDATFEAIAVNGDDVWVSFLRAGVYPRCRLDWSATLDEEIAYTAPAAAHAGLAVTLSNGGHYAGRGTLDGSGNYPGVTPAAGLGVGFDFDVELRPFPPYDARFGRNPTAIARVWCHIYQSGAFTVDGEYWSPYRFDDNLFTAPPVRTEDVEFLLYDNDSDSFLTTPLIKQTECAPLHIRALTMQGRY